MPNDTSREGCGCCGDGTPVGVVLSGNMKGTPACDECLLALSEHVPDPIPSEADSLDPILTFPAVHDGPVRSDEWNRKVGDWLGARPAAQVAR